METWTINEDTELSTKNFISVTEGFFFPLGILLFKVYLISNLNLLNVKLLKSMNQSPK